MTLRERIEQEIRERGPIPFSRYMERCLYEPDMGYYARRKEQFGKAGDFYTSSDVHAPHLLELPGHETSEHRVHVARGVKVAGFAELLLLLRVVTRIGIVEAPLHVT